ncbi:uncharacterized protein MONBRDRAFT_9856 [Monosiga brevicollis MX1]|uniref:Embryonic stem cell-specific 5-hydroxymethylcytosine-binding protein n=1 Tax=Monosiga brevicollis TaxID=81824 RepID=A9V4F7_MONBE|nr:uncharacterized protein MONBRDRAFT_9856 [Monosiga brevicollis MX1]EDQ87701.1 predicted protein [Monosiga brevicollis MX1]|eukprot:XP_001747621.1 hypothetical protein [Monosiga brevicollis MX1]
MCGRAACTLAPRQLAARYCGTRSNTGSKTTTSSAARKSGSDAPETSTSPCDPTDKANQQQQFETKPLVEGEANDKKPGWESAACEGTPSWHSCFRGDLSKYHQSYNTTPKQYLPVLVQDPKTGQRVFHVMQWGLVPAWHRGSPRDFDLTMFNARIEGILDKASPLVTDHFFCLPPLCIEEVDGFFEWEQSDDQERRQPFFIYSSDKANVARGRATPQDIDALKSDIQPLLMAGLWDVWQAKDPAVPPLYTFTIVTVPASAAFAPLHDRMPAILDTPEKVDAWLTPLPDATPSKNCQLLAWLSPSEALSWHPVSTKVGSIKAQGPELIKRVQSQREKKQRLASSMSMSEAVGCRLSRSACVINV